MNRTMLLYFAAPLFNANELAFNARLTEAIEQLGYEVFLPQREGLELIPKLKEAGADTITETIFGLDWSKVRECDVCGASSTGGSRTRGWLSKLVSATPTGSTTSPTGT